MQMHAANNKGIKIIGALILRLSGTSRGGKTLETRQIVYVTPDSDKLFLSLHLPREACTSLGIIPSTFPTIGDANLTPSTISAATTEKTTPDPTPHHQTCNWPKRQLPPPKPTKLPFPASAENREHLQQWLLDHHKSSSFNTCEHQAPPS